MGYPLPSIRINKKEVLLSNIKEGLFDASSAFEQSTFDFLQRWLNGQEEFRIQTSGSTGPPKEIVITREQMEASARATQRALGLQQNLGALTCLDTQYIAGQMMLVRSLIVGMRIIAIQPLANPLSHLDNEKIHFTALVPYQLNAVLNSAQKADLSSIDTIIVGGAEVSSENITELQGMNCKVFATYGMTETVSHIALKLLNGKEKEDSFKLLPGISIAKDDRSCLVVDCPYLTSRIVTNDMVEIVNPTSFIWKGRWDNILNSGGVKLSPEAIEKKLEPIARQLGISGRFVISAIPDQVLQDKLVLVVEGLPPEGREAYLKSLKNHLPKFEAPKAIITLPAFPETKSGKINRPAIKELLRKIG